MKSIKIFNKTQILVLKESLETVCLKCSALNYLCHVCPLEQVLDSLTALELDTKEPITRKKFTNLLPSAEPPASLAEVIFEKNDILNAQNQLETICASCDVSFCEICALHEIRRTLASLPVQESPLLKINQDGNIKKSGCHTCSFKSKSEKLKEIQIKIAK